VVFARQLITVLSRELTTKSFPEIARAIGKPNHSTVIAAFTKYHKTSGEKVLDLWCGEEPRTRTEWADEARMLIVKRSA